MIKYFDKSPLRSYSLGPVSSGVLETQPFKTEWTGFQDSGRVYLLNSGVPVSVANVTGSPESFSFSFDSGNRFWYALEYDGLVKIYGLSGTIYSFQGDNPQLYNNSVLVRRSNDTFCFYTKSSSSIFYRTSRDNFLSERVAFSGSQNLKCLTQVIKAPEPYYYRLSIYGLNSQGNGLSFLSKKHEPIPTGFYQPFTGLQSGQISTIEKWNVEELWGTINPAFLFDSQPLDNVTTGEYSGVNSFGRFINVLSGTNESFSGFSTGNYSGAQSFGTLLNELYFANDSLETAPTGSVTLLSGSNQLYGGYFING